MLPVDFAGLCCGPPLTTASTARSNRSQAFGSNSISFGSFAMPRQPFFKHPKVRRFIASHPDEPSFRLDMTDEIDRPDHLSKIALCLTLWPDVDLQLARLLALLTHANVAPMIAVYSVIRRATGRYDAISAAARLALDKRGQAIVAAMISVIQTIEGHRNDLAHGHWGISDALPDTILWMSGSNTVDIFINPEKQDDEYVYVDDSNILYYYSIRHFDEIIRDIKQSHSMLADFTRLIKPFRGKDGVFRAKRFTMRPLQNLTLPYVRR